MTDYIKREDAQDIIARKLSDYITDEERWILEYVDGEIGDIPSADVVEAIPRNDGFNILIGELLEIEARADIGCFTSRERAEFGFYVSRLLFDMTKEVKHECKSSQTENI